MNVISAVVMGASAGGVEAMLKVLGMLPTDYGLPVIAVLHLPDERHSQLAAVFASRLRRPVKEAEDKERVEAGMFYFAGPGYHLSVERDFRFSLSQEDRVHFSRPAIDLLFTSAADAWGPALAGVLMTGANQDGAAGLASIAREGGLTLVQDPSEARMPTMPQAALDLFRPAHVLTLNGIGTLLAELESKTC